MADYSQLSGFQEALRNRIAAQQSRAGADRRYRDAAHADINGGGQNALNQAMGQFASLFRQLVGRDPDENEANQFATGTLVPNAQVGAHESIGFDDFRDRTTQFINDNFQRTAEEQAAQDLQNQQAEAGRLAEMFRTQGRQALNDTESQLMDYQSRLFEKLRPQLMTSLQSQGLLNSGALNEAFAGQAKDLSDASQQFLMQQKLDMENQANQIAFGGASAPYEYQRGMIFNRVPYLQAQGEAALNRGFQQRQDEMAFNRQLQLMNMQRQKQPSLLKQVGGQMLFNVANSFTQNPFSNSYNSPSYSGNYNSLQQQGMASTPPAGSNYGANYLKAFA